MTHLINTQLILRTSRYRYSTLETPRKSVIKNSNIHINLIEEVKGGEIKKPYDDEDDDDDDNSNNSSSRNRSKKKTIAIWRVSKGSRTGTLSNRIVVPRQVVWCRYCTPTTKLLVSWMVCCIYTTSVTDYTSKL
ncbi:hypothetical protein RUM44_003750 [Polyplax serrata]|uniref:Uncharacterized protein n=1 Tax=Polyplax serrata TaxID=468196 RepID=A0ABR1AJ07_POLSC